ncbi:unnamed protein product [Hapterophycus canaliculatus]
MYHALDRAIQKTVLQEQPHVSNFISGKGMKDGVASGGVTATTSTGAAASSVPAAGDGAAEAYAATAATAAASSAATREVMATGGGGGGGQRPAGVTQAQHRSLVALRKERDRRLKDQQRLAAAGVTQSASAAAASTARLGGAGGRNLALAKAAAIAEDWSGTGTGSGVMSLSSIPTAMMADAPRIPAGVATATTAATEAFSAGFGFRSPRAGGAAAASGAPSAPSSTCSDGLRRAANLALRKNDLMSPTMRRLLQDPSQLRMQTTQVTRGDDGDESGASETDADVSSPGSEESGLDTEEIGGGGGGGGQMTPAELRGSTSGVSPFSSARSGSVCSDSYLSSCSSSSTSDGRGEDGTDEQGVENQVDGGDGAKNDEETTLPTRVLFCREEDEVEAQQQESPMRQQPRKQQRTSAIARTAAHASAARFAALDMPPPPPRPPAIATATKETAAQGLDELYCPSPRDSIASSHSAACTPTRGILSDGSGKDAGATSSTAKRRVRFETEKQMREASLVSLSAGANLTSPCWSSTSTSAGGSWGEGVDGCDSDGEEETVHGGGHGPAGARRGRMRTVVAALAVAISVGVVAFLGGGAGAGAGAGVGSRGHGSDARVEASSASSCSSPACSSPACFSPVALPWLPQRQHLLEVCPAAVAFDGKGGVPPDNEREQPRKPVEAGDQETGGTCTEHGRQHQPQHQVKSGEDSDGHAEGAQEPAAATNYRRKSSPAVPASATVKTEGGSYAMKATESSTAHAHRRKASPATEGGSYAMKATGTGTAHVHRRKASPPPPASSPSPLPAAPASAWGWVEAGTAVLGAAVLLATVVWKARSGANKWSNDGCGGGNVESDAPSTPNRGGVSGGGEGEELGRYETVELIKKGDTPAALRSVKRSRRIGSAQKISSTSGTVVMDLGVTALDFANT